tara:strand:- start:146 stop:1309 length:1164 start_codon:yes stop_codon:yes gene_type:complete
VKFISSLTDPGQPYSCSQWQNGGLTGMPLVLDENQSSTGFFDLFHDSWSAFPTFVIIDHTMTVRAKPWNLDNNSNTNSCDGSNGVISGWSGGSTENFLQQLVDECDDLCISGGCTTALGDINEDEILNIQDLITMVNHILGSSFVVDCALEAADMNLDGVINIQDLISLVNAILGSGRISELHGHADIEYIISGSDMILQIKSDIDLAGLQLSLKHDDYLDIELKDNSHISQDSYFSNGATRYLAYSLFNQPFDSHTIELLIHSMGKMDMEDIQVTLSDINGDAISISHVNGSASYQTGPYKFELSNLYPNPFNPSTEVSFSLPADNHVKLSVYNIQGQEIDIIFEGAQSLGSHSYTWNGSDFSSGVYYIRLQSGNMVTSQKALLVK